jgi:hypothetical protein
VISRALARGCSIKREAMGGCPYVLPRFASAPSVSQGSAKNESGGREREVRKAECRKTPTAGFEGKHETRRTGKNEIGKREIGRYKRLTGLTSSTFIAPPANITFLVLPPASLSFLPPPSLPLQMEPPTRIRRTIRACLQCRTRKQRCDGPYTVPCQRCKSAGRECSFEAEAVPESPRFHPYSGDRNFSPHALAEVQREYVPTLHAHSSSRLTIELRPIRLTDTKRRLEIVETKLGIVPTKTPKYEDDGPTSETLSVDIRCPPFALHLSPALHNHSHLISPSSPQSWQDVNSPPSAVQDPPPRPESPPRKSVNSIALAAPMATLRNLASFPGGPANNNQPSTSRDSTPEPTHELPPSVISSFDPIKRGVITIEEADKLFTMSVDRSLPATIWLIRALSRYFENNYPLAPFLCARTQRNAMHVRSTSVLLFVSVCCIGARYWNW